MDARRHYARLVAAFAAALFLALAVAASGMISLLTNREVLTETDAGPLVGPIMFAVAVLALYVQLVALGSREPSRRGSTIISALVAGVVVYFLFLLAGSTLYSLGKGRPLPGLLFFGSNALGPFAPAVGVIAIVVAFAYLILLSYRDSGGVRQTPRWPWERRDQRDRES